jgi:protein-S-isoprenylcysteine O-methyltransferase Ste14
MEGNMTVWSNLPKLSIPICLIWFVSEIVLARLLHSKSDSSNKLDRSSLRLLWLAIIPSIFAGAYLGSRGIGYVPAGAFIVSVCGLALIIIGLAIRWTAILTLKRRFTVDVNIQHGHEMVTGGIYGIVRHPAYSGTLLSFLGLGLTFANWLSTLVIFIPILVAFLYRIRVEEKVLIGHFGESYIAYCGRVKRLIPLIY